MESGSSEACVGPLRPRIGRTKSWQRATTMFDGVEEDEGAR